MHTSNKKLSLIIPFYNEERLISASYQKLTRYLHDNIPNYELIFVNDGSTDNSRNIISRQILKDNNCRLISYSQNKGRGYAIKKGFGRASGNIIGYIDSDLEINPKYLGKCLKEIESYDCVIVSKHLKNSRVDSPKIRKVASWIFNFWVRYVLDLQVSDTQAGLKLFRRKKLIKVLEDVVSDGWLADVEILYFFKKNDFSIKEIPINVSFGRGKIRKSFIIDFLRSFIMVWQLRKR